MRCAVLYVDHVWTMYGLCMDCTYIQYVACVCVFITVMGPSSGQLSIIVALTYTAYREELVWGCLYTSCVCVCVSE